MIAGDTLFISGGTTGKIYTKIWSVGAAGTSSEPIRITLDATNANHNGPVIFDYDHLGDYVRVSALLCRQVYVIPDGNVNGERHLVFRNLRNITNGFGPECILSDGARSGRGLRGVHELHRTRAAQLRDAVLREPLRVSHRSGPGRDFWRQAVRAVGTRT